MSTPAAAAFKIRLVDTFEYSPTIAAGCNTNASTDKKVVDVASSINNSHIIDVSNHEVLDSDVIPYNPERSPFSGCCCCVVIIGIMVVALVLLSKSTKH